jgi:hypothetical protein
MSTYTPTHCPETGRKYTKAERRIANKAKYAAEQAAKPKASKPKRKPKASKAKLKAKTIRKPKRGSNAGLEQAQARGGVGIGTPAKTKVVHAITEGDAQPFEPRKAVVVTPSPAKRAAVKEVFTLLDGETPQEAIRRQRILAEQERCALEAEALMSGAPEVF